jgi:hypothetical protein
MKLRPRDGRHHQVRCLKTVEGVVITISASRIYSECSRTGSATRHQINMVVVSPSKMLAALLPVKILDLGI